MTETSNTTNTALIPAAAELDVVVEVLSHAFDDMKPVAIATGPDKINLSLTSNWGAVNNLEITLWDEDDESGSRELGTYSVTIQKVI